MNLSLPFTFPPAPEIEAYTDRQEAYHPDGRLNYYAIYNMWREEILGIFSDMGYGYNFNMKRLTTECFTEQDNLEVMNQLLPLREHVNFLRNQMHIIDTNLTNLINKLNFILSDLLIGFKLPYYRNTNINPNFEMVFLSNLNIVHTMLKNHMVVSAANEEAFHTKNISINITLFIKGFLGLFKQPITTPEGQYITQEDFDRFRDILNQILAIIMSNNNEALTFATLLESNQRKDNEILELQAKLSQAEHDKSTYQQEILRQQQVMKTNSVSDVMSLEHKQALEALALTQNQAIVIGKHNDELVKQNKELEAQLKQFHERIAAQDNILNELRETERKYNALVTVSEEQEEKNQQLQNNIAVLNAQQEGGIATIANLKEQIEQLKVSIHEQENLGQQYTEERVKLNKQIIEQTAEIQDLNTRIILLNEEIERMQTQNNNYLLEQNRLNAVVNTLKQRIEELNQQIADQEALKERVQNLNNEIQARIERENNMNITIEEQFAEKNQLQEILNQLNRNTENNNVYIGNLNQQTKSYKEKINSLMQEVKQYEEQIAELNQQISKYNIDIKNLKFDISTFRGEREGLFKKIELLEENNNNLSVMTDMYQEDKRKLTEQIEELERQINSLLKEKSQLQKSIDTTLRDQKLLKEQQEVLKEKIRNHDPDMEEQNKFLDDELRKYELINQGYKYQPNGNPYIDYVTWLTKQGDFVKDLVTDLDNWCNEIVTNYFNKLIPNELNITTITLMALKYITVINNVYVNKHRESVAAKEKTMQRANELIQKWRKERTVLIERYETNKKELAELLEEKIKWLKFNNNETE